MDFHPVEENLREMFRSLSAHRPPAEVREGPGITIVSLRAAFQMFNAVFLAGPVDCAGELRRRIEAGAAFMEARGLPWSLWVCEDWLTPALRKPLAQICSAQGLRLASQMPGMAVERLAPTTRALPRLEMRAVDCPRERRAFCDIGSVCFHVPADWFEEVFDHGMQARQGFQAWVGYCEEKPVATAATVISGSVIGLYNLAIAPDFQRKGYAEPALRHAIAQAHNRFGLERVVLQSTRRALSLYERLGFSTVTQILVFTS